MPPVPDSGLFIPYGRQWVDEEDIQAVVEVLRSDLLTTGPKVEAFERALAEFVGVKEAVAVNSGTAALHAAMYAVGVGPGDEVILPPMTFAATANAVLWQRGTPVFADVAPDTLLLDPARVEEKITPHTKAIVAVDYAGHPCDYDTLRGIATCHGLYLIADACHSLGAAYKGKKVGTLADLSVFSFHPVKQVTTGEGGAVVTEDSEMAKKIRCFRNHGITTDHRLRSARGTWFYEMRDLGFNYRLSDILCALGVSQLRKLPAWLARRREIAECYDDAFVGSSTVEPLARRPLVEHAYHLYVINLELDRLKESRRTIFEKFWDRGVHVNVHYIPVHLHPYYRRRLSTGSGLCPVAEEKYEGLLSLPIFPKMSQKEVGAVVASAHEILQPATWSRKR
jgi:perosamine synthetase